MKCKKCGKKIEYNRYVVYQNDIYCPKCYSEIKPEENNIQEPDASAGLVKPNEEAIKQASKYGIKLNKFGREEDEIAEDEEIEDVMKEEKKKRKYKKRKKYSKEKAWQEKKKEMSKK